MRGTTIRGIWLLAAWLALSPHMASAQQYAPADPQIWAPIGSTRPEDGGFYVWTKAGLYRQSNPLRSQLVAVRGFFAYDTGAQTVVQTQLFRTAPDGTITPATQLPINPATGAQYTQTDLTPDTSINQGNPTTDVVFTLGGIVFQQNAFGGFDAIAQYFRYTTEIPGLFSNPGFLGSAAPALDVEQLRQRAPYQPSMELGMGWKFNDGTSLSMSWFYLTEVQHRAGATLAPPNVNASTPAANSIGTQLENTFLFSPVYNFPPEFAGADDKVNTNQPPNPQTAAGLATNPQTVFGIWNGASIMTLDFRQRFQQWEMTYRVPIFETESYRINGIVGPKFAWFWERFRWRTTSYGQRQEFDGTITLIDGPQFVGIYTNVTSNRMYGLHAGCEQEYYLGHGLACMLKTEGSLMMNSVKERAKYERGDKGIGPENKRALREWSLVPELQAQAGMMWYPTEFVQLFAAYDVMAFFNTRASPRPIDFDYSNINPRWTHVNRYLDGWNAGLSISF